MFCVISLFQPGDDDSELELRAALRNASARFRLLKTRTVYSAVALLSSVIACLPFLSGHGLHSYWNSVGQYIVMLSMVLLAGFAYCVGMFLAAWSCLRELRSELQGLTEGKI